MFTKNSSHSRANNFKKPHVKKKPLDKKTSCSDTILTLPKIREKKIRSQKSSAPIQLKFLYCEKTKRRSITAPAIALRLLVKETNKANIIATNSG